MATLSIAAKAAITVTMNFIDYLQVEQPEAH
jgi:hypothetical protein